MPGQYTTESTQRKVQKAVRCTAYGKGFLFFLQIHITGGIMQRLLVGIMLLSSVLAAGCAEIGKAGARLNGLTVVSADDCRHPMHTTPCKASSTPWEQTK